MNVFDTNLLVYAHRRDSAFHERARALLRDHAEALEPWGITWPSVHEFLAVVTNPKVFKQPTPLPAAIAEVEGWLGSPSLVLLGEADGYWPVLRELLVTGRIQGPKVHDARIADITQLHRAAALLCADRDFTRFPTVRVRNPL